MSADALFASGLRARTDRAGFQWFFAASRDGAETFEQRNGTPIDCALLNGGRLYVCDQQDGVPGLSVSDDDGATLVRIMTFRDVRTQVACPASSAVAATCAAPWADWQRELLTAATGDAGTRTADASASADAGRTDRGARDGFANACSVVNLGARRSPRLLCALALVFAARLNRRATRACPRSACRRDRVVA